MITHRQDYRALVISEDFIFICQGNLCKALILSVLEQITNKQETNFVPVSIPEFISQMHGLYQRNRITDNISELLKEGLIERRQISNSHKYVFEYRLNATLIQQMIDGLPIKSDQTDSIPHTMLLKEFNYLCAYCQSNKPTTWDHIIPQSKQGTSHITNLLPSCRMCNQSKSDTDVLTWMKSQTYTPSKILREKLRVMGIEVE